MNDVCSSGLCHGTPVTRSDEVCDGVDNDGDGLVDEGALTVTAERRIVGQGSHPPTEWDDVSDVRVRLMAADASVAAEGMTGGAGGDVRLEVEPGVYKITGVDTSDGSSFNSPAVNVACLEEVSRTIRQIMTTSNGKKHPATETIRTGSRLLVIEPEWIEWSGSQEYYPFVFESLGDWTVKTSVMPPPGFVADHPFLEAEVATDTQAVQFVVTDVGSEWTHTEVRHYVTHGARQEVIRSRIGVRLSAKLAKAEGVDTSGYPVGREMTAAQKREKAAGQPWPVEIAGWVIPSAVDPQWQIRIRVNVASRVKLVVDGADNRRVRMMTLKKLQPGEYLIPWDGKDTAGKRPRPGDYVLKLSTESFTDRVAFHHQE
jgi:hypothetical protein